MALHAAARAAARTAAAHAGPGGGGNALRIGWRAARLADTQEVRVRLGDGGRLWFRTRRSSLTVHRVGRRVRGTVTVRGVCAAGRPGKPAVARPQR